MSNPTKLRKLSARIGQPVIRAYARWFADQTTLLVFTDDTTAWVVPRVGDIERYLDEPVRLVKHGVQTGGDHD